MNSNYPTPYLWFSKLNITKFIPWHIEPQLSEKHFANKRFSIEAKNREVITFASRQDMDTFAGFEIKNGIIQENVLVFHLSFGSNNDEWNVVKKEHQNFFSFIKETVLPDMEEWITADDVEDYI